MACENCKNEKREIALSTESARIVADMVQEKNKLLRICCGVIVALLAAVIIEALCMVWAVQNAQKVANEAMKEALNTVAEIGVSQEETTTQTVEGDSAAINNVEGDQYNDNATHNDFTADSEEATE